MNISILSKKITGILKQFVRWPLFILSFIVPRNKKLWVFGSFAGTSFIDNSKYYFSQLYLQNPFEIRAIWITQDKTLFRTLTDLHYECYMRNSWKGVYYSLRAFAYVYSWSVDDINWYLSGGAKWISLWHGIPLKKIGFGTKQDEAKKMSQKEISNPVLKLLAVFLRPDLRLFSDLFLSPSKEISKIFKESFFTKAVVEAMYPRVAHFILPEKEQHIFTEKIMSNSERKMLGKFTEFSQVWIYMPTFRDNRADDLRMGTKEVFDTKKIAEILQKKNILLIVKFHMASAMNKNKNSDDKNILYLDGQVDVYTILPFVHGLITDYSSIFFDFMLLKKPMAFYCFDIATYNANSRDFNFTYEEVIPGPIIPDFKSLCKWFENIENQPNPDYDEHVQRFWGDSLNTKPEHLTESILDL